MLLIRYIYYIIIWQRVELFIHRIRYSIDKKYKIKYDKHMRHLLDIILEGYNKGEQKIR